MSDLVERLRAAASHPYNQHGPHEFLTEAADRIAKLEAALQKYDEANRLQHDYANKCRADLARKDKALLAALNDLTEHLTESGELPDSVTIAVIRAALEDKT